MAGAGAVAGAEAAVPPADAPAPPRPAPVDPDRPVGATTPHVPDGSSEAAAAATWAQYLRDGYRIVLMCNVHTHTFTCWKKGEHA